MTSTVCVDASVAAKWLLREPDRSVALRFRTAHLTGGGEFIAPFHFPGEVASAIYKTVRAGKMRPEYARLIASRIPTLSVQLYGDSETTVRALDIAMQFNLKWIYDALYVALADIVGCDMWTADASLHASVRDAFPNVHLLTEMRSA